jgi:MFS family permease
VSQERPSLRRAVAALQHRDYSLFYLGLVVAAVGSQVQQFANIWQIFEMTGSPLHLGLTGLARAIPLLALSLMGGVIADRVNRRQIILLAQGISGLMAVVLAALTYTHVIEVWHIYATILVSGTLMALSAPARSAIIPNLVPRHHLMNAIALQSTQWQIANIVGPAIGGVLVMIIGLGATYLTNGAAHVVTLIALAMIQMGPIAARQRQSAYRSLVEGLSFIRRKSVILALLGTDAAATFFGHYRVLLPFVAVNVGWEGAEGTGLLMAAPGVGSLLGATAIMSLGDFRYKGLVAVVAILGYCVALILLAVSPWFLMALLVAAALGFLDSCQATPRNTVIQSITPDEMRGRVASFQQMLTSGMPSLGQAYAGALAAVVGPGIALVSGAAACIGIVLGIAAARPDLRARDLGSEPTEPEPVPEQPHAAAALG